MKIVNPIAVAGEDLASKYLAKIGYTIIERNFRKNNGELDIVATHKGILVFVEVKTRTSDQFGTPLESITPSKIRTITKTAQFYKLLHPKLPDSLRIDAIAVDLSIYNNPKIEHIENISGF